MSMSIEYLNDVWRHLRIDLRTEPMEVARPFASSEAWRTVNAAMSSTEKLTRT